VKAVAAIAAGVAAGLLAAVVWTWLQPTRYRAEARVLVRGTEPGRVLPAVEALAESSLVEENVAQTLHLASTPKVSAKSGKSGVLTVSVEADGRERARQIDAEAVIVLMQKIPQRFVATPRISTTVLDPAHAVEQTSPTPGRNFLLAGLAGLAAGIAAVLAFRRPRVPLEVGSAEAEAERRLRSRIDEVAKRERALAKRAGELAARERALDERAAERQPQEVIPQPAPVPPTPVQAAEPVVARGDWNLLTLERLVRDRMEADPAEHEAWTTYLFFLRDHAAPDGSLPSSFEPLLNDVFGELASAAAAGPARELGGEGGEAGGVGDSEETAHES
jgi:capsular polysaccharide biosynthesis protein